MNSSFLTEEELELIGFRKYGKNVCISRNCMIYGAENISLGDNVRIDDFCVLSGNIMIGSNIHISVYSGLFGGNAGIEIGDFGTVSSRCMIYAKSDDYSGEHLTNPTIPDDYLGVISEKVILEKHVIVGSGCTILPGVNIGEGSAVGSMSLVNKSLEPWGIYYGIPCRFVKNRSKKLLEFEKKYLDQNN